MASEAGRTSNSNSVLMQRLGGAKNIAAELREYQDRVVQLERQHPELERKYADQWMVLTKSGTLVSGNTVDEAVAKLNDMGISRRGSVIKFVASEPVRLIL